MKDFCKGIVFVGLFAIPFIPLIVADSMFFPFITGKNFTFRILVEIVIAAWIILALLDTNYRPRFSWLLSGASAFIVVMFFANFFAEYPLKSFWSNFERMDGYVTLVHFYLLFVVLGSVLRDRKLWVYYLSASVAAATYVAFTGLQQLGDASTAWRIQSTLGNAAYMAVYMLFHIFFTVWLFVESRQWWVRSALGILFTLFTYMLFLTATRGTFIGLTVGLGITALYLIIFSKEYPAFRKAALGVLAVLIVAVGSIFTFKESAFVTDNRTLDRIASIDLREDLSIRMDIWEMALAGVKERPILGWGQGNFNYIFNEQYNPDLYNAEAWYDRAHNIVMDWLVAGGILGLLTYLSIFLALGYYLLWRPLWMRGGAADGRFTVPERAVLIGLVSGYFIHNLVVFDNIVSYLSFAAVLGLIHARISEEMPRVSEFSIDSKLVSNVVAPVVLVVAGVTIWFVNIPGLQAAGDIIDALKVGAVDERLLEMEEAIDRDSFAYQEIVEQLGQQAMQVMGNPNIPAEQKQAFATRAEEELLRLAERKPGDARVHVFISGFYRSIGNVPEARRHAAIARELSPQKQAIILEQGVIEYQAGDFGSMHQFFKEAYELQPKYRLARNYYASSLLYIGETEKVDEVLADEDHFAIFANDNFAVQSANRFEAFDLLARMLEVRIADEPENPQTVASLAFVYYQAGDIEAAIAALESGIDRMPEFAEKGQCYIANLEAGVNPDEGC